VFAVTTKVLLGDEIGSQIHDIFAGEHFPLGGTLRPYLYILSPWISNVEIKGKIPKMGPMSPQIGYEFESMDLAHAILLAILLFDIEVNLVTKPPDEKTYPSDPSHAIRLLDFLDEIGCNIYVNDLLHSKMLLTREIAIIGSLNLTKAALYDREEIAVSIDDLENLYVLERYAEDIREGSEPYGYTANRKTKKVTRGVLYEMLGGGGRIERSTIENILSNIEFFYMNRIIELMMEVKSCSSLEGYNGPYRSKSEAMVFLENALARRRFPEIESKFKKVDFDFEEFMKQWDLKHFGKKTRQRESG